MTFTDTALALLKSLEGCRLTSYPDIAGVWTIGYGHTGAEVVPGLSWTPDHAESALAEDVGHFTPGVEQLLKAPLSDNQFSALVIFAYNIGLAAFEHSSALAAINSGTIGALDQVPSLMLRWNKVHDPVTHQLVESAGLTKRRQSEIALWNTP